MFVWTLLLEIRVSGFDCVGNWGLGGLGLGFEGIMVFRGFRGLGGWDGAGCRVQDIGLNF